MRVVVVLFGLLLIILPTAASARPSAPSGVLVYASVRDISVGDPGNPNGFADLFTVRADGTGFRRLTRTSWWEEDPAWSPDRKLIAYSRGDPYCHAGSCECGSMASSIWVMTADGRRRRPLTDGADDQEFYDEYPTWSPDSKKVAFARESTFEFGPEDGIYVVGVDGEGVERISRVRTLSLAWSPSGSTIAYVRRSDQSIELVDVATRRARRLQARGLSQPYSVEWSPRGHFLAVANEQGLFIVPATGGKARKIVTRGTGYVTWSPDGCCLAFSATRRGVRSPRADLYLVSVRGGRTRRLTSNPGPDFSPEWRP
jgi:Tol biopolymer transport system component